MRRAIVDDAQCRPVLVVQHCTGWAMHGVYWPRRLRPLADAYVGSGTPARRASMNARNVSSPSRASSNGIVAFSIGQGPSPRRFKTCGTTVAA